jgi:hypothetical protein
MRFFQNSSAVVGAEKHRKYLKRGSGRLGTFRRSASATTVAVVLLLTMGTIAAPVASAATPTSVSWTKTVNYTGGHFRINGPDGTWMVFQTDGNLVVYASGCSGLCTDVQWNTATEGLGARLSLQSDGNLVVYTSSNIPVFAANWGGWTGSGPFKLRIVTCYGYVPQITTRTGSPVWTPC